MKKKYVKINHRLSLTESKPILVDVDDIQLIKRGFFQNNEEFMAIVFKDNSVWIELVDEEVIKKIQKVAKTT